MLVIPIDPPGNENEIDISTTLDGARFQIRLSWSKFVGRWYLDLTSVGPEENESIISGASLLIGFPILLGNPLPNRPKGELALMPAVDSADDYAKKDLGTKVELIYFTAAELGR